MSHLPSKTTTTAPHENYSSVYILRFVVAFGLEKDFPSLSRALPPTAQKVLDFDWRNIKYHVSFIERFIANFKSDLEICFDCNALS